MFCSSVAAGLVKNKEQGCSEREEGSHHYVKPQQRRQEQKLSSRKTAHISIQSACEAHLFDPLTFMFELAFFHETLSTYRNLQQKKNIVSLSCPTLSNLHIKQGSREVKGMISTARSLGTARSYCSSIAPATEQVPNMH